MRRMEKPASKAGETWQSVLVLGPSIIDGKEAPRQASRIHRFYKKYREDHELPDRCDNEKCMFHLQPLEWNGEPLPYILDHADGNHWNNLPSNLRYLCPNCNSQSRWNGGKAKGRVVESTEDGWVLKTPGGGKEIGATGRVAGTAEVFGVGGTAPPKPEE